MSEGEAPSEKNRAFRFTTIKHYSLTRAPGICFCLVLVLASSYISEHYGITQILGALLLGMAFNSISRYDEFAPGLDFCVKNILRFGVALLGVRITFSQISALGAKPLLVVSVVVVTTLLFSVLLAKLLKVNQARGIISGAAVGICGVSAALAIASVIQSNKDTEKHLLCTLIGVTGMSTICMILYPGILVSLSLSTEQMGLFLGASIHDVAQVFGAGDMISPEVAQLATYTKMLRVAMLVPTVMVLAFLCRSRTVSQSRFKRILPTFLIAFVGFVVLANMHIVPAQAISAASDLSQVCLWIAMAALGAKTNLVELWQVGKNTFILLLLNTCFVAGVSILLVS